MKAYVLHGINDLRYQEIEKPQCEKGWVLVKVKAAGICSSDIPRIFTKGTYHFPTIPGHEYCGVVESVGDKADEVWIGKRVGVFPLIPCKKCQPCKNKNYEMCENYDYTGSRRDGGFAEYVAVPVWNLVELPNEVSYKQAALLEPLSVALHAVSCADVKKGDRVAVIGTGAIGFAAAQWAISLGASETILVGRNAQKEQLAKKLGVVYTQNPEGLFDVVIEAVGSVSAITRSLELAKEGGRVVFMGNPEGDITLPQSIYWRILRKQLTIKGTWNSAYESGELCDWSRSCDAIAKGEIKAELLISHEFTQEELPMALALMRDNKEPYCKVMTIWDN